MPSSADEGEGVWNPFIPLNYFITHAISRTRKGAAHRIHIICQAGHSTLWTLPIVDGVEVASRRRPSKVHLAPLSPIPDPRSLCPYFHSIGPPKFQEILWTTPSLEKNFIAFKSKFGPETTTIFHQKNLLDCLF